MSDDDVKLLVNTLSAAVAAGQKVSVPAERVLEIHARLLVARMERDAVERAARAAALREAAEVCETLECPDNGSPYRYGFDDALDAASNALRARAEGQ